MDTKASAEHLIKLAGSLALDCGKCGETTKPDAKFCHKCGHQNLKQPRTPEEMRLMVKTLKRELSNPFGDFQTRALMEGAIVCLHWALGEERNPLNEIANKHK